MEPWIEVAGSDRWQIYHRLQELEIPCRCRTHESLSNSSPTSNLATIRGILKSHTVKRCPYDGLRREEVSSEESSHHTLVTETRPNRTDTLRPGHLF